MKTLKTDVCIIGAGTAGLSARKIIAKSSKNYLVVDPGPLGTTCARVGCMPSKAFIHYSKSNQSDVDILKQTRSHRNYFVNHILKDFESWKNHFVCGKAYFLNKNTIQVNNTKIIAHNFIIATGTQPKIPKVWKGFEKFILTTNSFFEQKSIPKKIISIGLGPIGLELTQALKNIGVDILSISNEENFAKLSHSYLQKKVFEHFNSLFPIHFGTPQPIKIKNNQIAIKLNDKVFSANKILMSTGRTSNIKDLKLNNHSSHLSKENIPDFNNDTFQIPDTNLYLVGDANQFNPILHEAAYQGKCAAHHLLYHQPYKISLSQRPALKIIYSTPNICFVGKSAKELKEANIKFVTGTVSYKNQGRALLEENNIGGLEVYISKNEKKLLGSELFAPNGEHISHLLASFISNKFSLKQVLDFPFYHPTYEEGLKTAFNDALQKLNL